MDPINVNSKKGRKKYLKRIAWVLLLLILIFAGSGMIIGIYYKSAVRAVLIGEINKHLLTEVRFDDFNFSVFRSFPLASVEFTGVKAMEATKENNKDILLQAESIFLHFNVMDIIRKNYRIKKLEFDNTSLNLKIFEDLSDNFHIWQITEDIENTAFSLDLQKIILKKVKISFINEANGFSMDVLAEKVQAKGKFSDARYNLTVQGNFYANRISSKKFTILQSRETELKLNLSVDENSGTYKITKGWLGFKKLSFDITGDVISTVDKKFLDLSIKGRHLDLRSLQNELPDGIANKLNKYRAEGMIDFTAGIRGSYQHKHVPEFTVEFGLNNASIEQKKVPVAFENLNLKGTLTGKDVGSPETFVLDIPDFSAFLNKGKINGNLKIRDFVHPMVDVNAKIDIKMDDLQEFLQLDTIQSVSGRLEMDFQYHGMIDDINHPTAADFIRSLMSGKANIYDMNLKFKKDKYEYSDMSASLIFNNNDLIIEHFKGFYGKMQFRARGNFRNFLSSLMIEGENLYIDATFSTNEFNLDDILGNDQSGKFEHEYHLSFSDHVFFNLLVDIKHISFGKFNARNVRGKIILKDQKLMADELTFQSMKGNVTISGIIDGTNKDCFLFSCSADIVKVDVKDLFYQFDNFGQENLTDKNVRGELSADDVLFAMRFDPQLNIDKSSIFAMADITINKGELIDYAPMQSLSRFLKVDDLSHIVFSRLNNTIEIRDKQVRIPGMAIKSNAFDIVASGEHGFDNHINYRVRILLSELLARKAKEAKKENEEFGVIEDDGLGRTSLYILITGTVEEPVFRYDKQSVKQKIITEFQNEKKNLKKILNQEYGWFKNDSTVKNDTLKKKESKLIIEWDEAK